MEGYGVVGEVGGVGVGGEGAADGCHGGRSRLSWFGAVAADEVDCYVTGMRGMSRRLLASCFVLVLCRS